MLHLFNRIYLDTPDVLYNTKIGAAYFDWSHTIKENLKPDDQFIAPAFDFDDAENLFLNMLLADDKRAIHADIESFAKIAATWYKSTTNMSADDWAVYAACIVKHRELYNESYEGMKDFLIQYWDKAPELDMSSYQYTPSLEFMVASQVSGDTRYKSNLKKTFATFMRREIDDGLMCLMQHMELNILDDELQKVLGNTGDLLDVSDYSSLNFFKEIFGSSTYKSFENVNKSPYIAGSAGKFTLEGLTYTQAKKVVDAAVDVCSKLENTGSAQSSIAMFRTLDDEIPYLNSIMKGELTDTQLNKVIKEFLECKTDATHVSSTDIGRMGKINTIFISYCRTLYRTNLEKLKNYSLK